jgi:DNA-binding SARP family transcriptional activator
MSSKISYRQQYTRCGKQLCQKCREGAGHGPYWYAYWSEKGRTVSKYVGARLPDEVAIARQQDQNDVMPPQSSPVLRIYVLGQFRVDRKNGDSWSTIDSRFWRRRRASALLGCLISSPGRKLGREQLMDLLWPDLDVHVAANRLNGAVHELRQILDPHITRPASSRLLRLERDILELADNTQIWIDAEAFDELLKEARASSDPDKTEHLLEEAALLYRGGYLLEELYSEWAGQRRDALHRNWVGLLLDLAELQIERGSFPQAIETLNRLRSVELTNETALQRLMQLFTQLDRRGEALQMYRQHAEMLERDYEDQPLPETRQLYDELRKGKHAPPFPAKPDSPRTSKSPSQRTPPPTSASTSPAQKLTFIRPVLHAGRPNQSPLIGRQGELETMQEVLLALENVAASPQRPLSGPSPSHLTIPRTDRSHMLLLTGEPGIGKTRLAEELSIIAYGRGWTISWSRSFEQEGTVPYRPWIELLRVLLQNTFSTFDDISNNTLLYSSTSTVPFNLDRLLLLLPELPRRAVTSLHSSPPLPYEQERQYLWEAVLGLFDMLSIDSPLLLVFDDLHWADDSSIELLAYLIRHLQARRVLVLATCRDTELPAQSKLRALIADLHREQRITTVAVQSLTQEQIGLLVSHLHRDLIQSIQAQAAGNPFFAEELARSLGRHSLAQESPGSANVQPIRLSPRASLMPTQTSRDLASISITALSNSQIPDAIASVLERRLGRLSNDCQALLSKAAVLGGSFELCQIVPMSNEHTEDTIINLIDEALQAGLLTEEGVGKHISYHFWHPLIIDHLYNRLSAARRAYFHRKAAEALKTAHSPWENIAASIVNHLRKGGSNPDDLAYYSELAGNQAYVVAAYAEAQHYYLQTIQALVGGILQVPVGDSMHIRQITPQIIAGLPVPTRLHICQLLDRIAECHVVPGNYEDARYLYECILAVRTRDDVQRFIALSAGDDTTQLQREIETQALLWREIGNTWSDTGEYDCADECYQRGTEVMQRAGITTGIAWASLHARYGLKLRFDGRYQEARHYLQEALTVLEIYIELPTFDAQQSNTFLTEQESGTTPTAWLHGQQQKVLHTRSERTLWGHPFELGYAHEQLGVNLVNSGPLSEALQHLHLALSIYKQCGLLSEMVHVSGNLGAVYIMKGEHTTAREFLMRSLELAECIGDLPNMAFVTGNLGDVALRSGDLLAAEEWFERSLELAERISDREGMSWSSIELASVQRDLGKLEDAKRSILRAITIGRAIKNSRCVLYALVEAGELRIIEALHSCSLPLVDDQDHNVHDATCRRLLLRARSTLQHALSQDGLEIETFIEGQYLLATTCYLLGERDFAYQLAMQILQDAQKNETDRIVGCIHCLLGRILAKQGDYEKASVCFKQALTLFRKSDLRLDYARTLRSYGVSLLESGVPLHRTRSSSGKAAERQVFHQRGLDALLEAQRIFSDCHAALDLTWTEHTLAQFKQHTEAALIRWPGVGEELFGLV